MWVAATVATATAAAARRRVVVAAATTAAAVAMLFSAMAATAAAATAAAVMKSHVRTLAHVAHARLPELLRAVGRGRAVAVYKAEERDYARSRGLLTKTYGNSMYYDLFPSGDRLELEQVVCAGGLWHT